MVVRQRRPRLSCSRAVVSHRSGRPWRAQPDGVCGRRPSPGRRLLVDSWSRLRRGLRARMLGFATPMAGIVQATHKA